jgi:hypothetical protein
VSDGSQKSMKQEKLRAGLLPFDTEAVVQKCLHIPPPSLRHLCGSIIETKTALCRFPLPFTHSSSARCVDQQLLLFFFPLCFSLLSTDRKDKAARREWLCRRVREQVGLCVDNNGVRWSGAFGRCVTSVLRLLVVRWLGFD